MRHPAASAALAIDQKAPDFLPYLVVIIWDAIALIASFWRDWWAFLESLINPGSSARRRDRRSSASSCLESAVIVGFVWKRSFALIFGSRRSPLFFSPTAPCSTSAT